MDPKTSLQEVAAGRGAGQPVYTVTNSGPDHSKTFHATVVGRRARHGVGRGDEQEAGRDGRRPEGLDRTHHATVPELPEVEVVRAGLAPAVTGATIVGVEVFEQRSLKRHDPVAGDFEALVTGRRMLEPARRGKFLWIPLDGDEPRRAIVAHLGMSGQLLLREPGTTEEGLLRIRLHVEHPGSRRALGALRRPADLRVDGRGRPRPDCGRQARRPRDRRRRWSRPRSSHIARDPLDPAFDDDAFARALAKKNTGIKRALLDQTLVSGIGNIYADEALWAAKLHYEQPTATLSRRRVRAAALRGAARAREGAG